MTESLHFRTNESCSFKLPGVLCFQTVMLIARERLLATQQWSVNLPNLLLAQADTQPRHIFTDSGCFKCSYNRTSNFKDFDLGTALLMHKYKAASTMECIMACHFRNPQCLAVARHKETCTLLITKDQDQKGQLFKNYNPSFFAYNIKCQLKYDDDE